MTISRRFRQVRTVLLGVLGAAAAVLVLVAAAGHDGPAPAAPGPLDQRVPNSTLDVAAARTALNALAVAEPMTVAGYDRDCGRGHGCVFGPAWTDDVTVTFGRNGCDTRNDVLRRDIDPATVVVKDPARPCKVTGGTLHDPYTGRAITVGPDNSQAIQIDHLVPLAAAWRAGAHGWTPAQRRNFANDPGNLLAVDGPTNQDKGDATADTWLPRSEYRCSYARIIVTVKTSYQLSVAASEKTALAAALSTCDLPAATPGVNR